jgi:nucleoside-diphosphate-sugar epimerase
VATKDKPAPSNPSPRSIAQGLGNAGTSCLLVGGSGFLGSSLRRSLTAAGYRVLVTRGPRSKGIAEGEFALDLATGDGLEGLPWENVDLVIYLAAAGVKAANRKWRECIDVNVVGLNRFIGHMASLRTPPKLLFARTFYEETIPSNPTLYGNPYVFTKYLSTRLVEEWAERCSLGVTFLKIFNVFGPGDAPANVLSYAAGQLKKGLPARFSSGRIQRDWIYVDDFCEGCLAAIGTAQWGGETIDLGTGKLQSVRDMVEAIVGICAVPAELVTFDPGLDRNDEIDGHFARNLPSGWQPRFSTEEGLEKLCRST